MDAVLVAVEVALLAFVTRGVSIRGLAFETAFTSLESSLIFDKTFGNVFGLVSSGFLELPRYVSSR